TETVERFGAAMLGVMVGSRLGPKGAIAGGILGSLSPEIKEVLRDLGVLEQKIEAVRASSASNVGRKRDRGDFTGLGGDDDGEAARATALEQWQAHLAQLQKIKDEAGKASREKELEAQ